MENYLQKVDSDYGFSVAKKLISFRNTEKGFRLAGTRAENEAADWIAEEMKSIGLQEVTKESLRADSWDFREATVTVLSPNKSESMEVCSFPFLEGTAPEGITGEVVYVGDGTRGNYQGIDVKDKIVLIDTDAYYTYWYNSIFSQAEERGAKAVIATVMDRGPGTYTDDIISVQDVMGVVNIPAVMMTKRDGDKLRTMLKEGKHITVNIKADIRLTENAEAHYVHGKIIGRNPNRYILVCGHYDAYWDGFQDNATSLGAQMTIAKAMIDSGYKPESTFVFITNGAEECGIKDTYFDFATGAAAIAKQHPEWISNMALFNNFENPAIDQTDKFKVAVTGSYKKAFDSVLSKLELDNGHAVFPTRIVGSDDGIFNKAGAPTYMRISASFGEENPEAMENYDHTQYDNVDRYEPEVFDFNNRIHGIIDMSFDSMPVLPFDFTWDVENYMNFMDENIAESLYPAYPELKVLLESINEKAVKCYNRAIEVNRLTERIKAIGIDKESLSGVYDQAWEQSQILLKINRNIHKEIYKFGPFSNVIIGYVQPYEYVRVLDALAEELKSGSPAAAFTELCELDNNFLIEDFDKRVYEKVAIEAFDSSIPESWGYGETLPFPDLYDVVTAIEYKKNSGETNFSGEILEVKAIRDSQHDILKKTMDREKEAFYDVAELLDTIDFESIISIEKKIIEETEK